MIKFIHLQINLFAQDVFILYFDKIHFLHIYLFAQDVIYRFNVVTMKVLEYSFS